MARKLKKIKVAFRRETGGTKSIGIAARGCSAEWAKDGSLVRLLDVDEQLPNHIEIDGLKLPIRLILKLYCHVPKRLVRQVRLIHLNRELQRLRPILFERYDDAPDTNRPRPVAG